MRGQDWFGQPDERDWAHIYDRQIMNYNTQQLRAGRDFIARPFTNAEYQEQYDICVRDNDYLAWRRRRDRELEGERVFWKGVDPLDIVALPEVTSDRPRLAPFKLKYDTLEEVRLRFSKTVILVKGNPFVVADQRMVNNEFYLLLEDRLAKKSYVPIAEVPDLRPAPAGYIRIQEYNGYMKRTPARVNQQGMTTQNVVISQVGTRAPIGFALPHLVEALSCRGQHLPWDKAYYKLIDDRIVSSLRLSDTIALYKKPTAEATLVEYKGRRLGELTEHTVKLFDEDDIIQPWLKADLDKVNLEVTT